MSVNSQDYKDAVFVGLTKSISGARPIYPVKFDKVDVDVRGSYDPRGGKYYAIKDGIYWTSISGCSQPRHRLHLQLYREASHYAGLARFDGNTLSGQDTRSRDIMVRLKALQSLRVMHNDGDIFSDDGLQTSFLVFRLTDLMTENIFFSAANQNTIFNKTNEIMQFPEILVNEGNAYDNKTSIFKVPKDGHYFISFSTASYWGKTFDGVLRRNAAILGTLESFATQHERDNSLSRGVMVKLMAGDLIYVYLDSRSTAYSAWNRLSSFSGFLYDQVTGKRAWSVARKSNWKGGADDASLTFEEVLVNINGDWQADQHVYIASVAGVYYITYTVGIQAYAPAEVNLMVNEQTIVSLTRTTTDQIGQEMISRSALVHLSYGSRVYLVAKGRSSIYSTHERQTSFTGFLLFPHSKDA